MADPDLPPGKSDPRDKLQGPDYYREDLQLYADRYTARPGGTSDAPALFAAIALITALLPAIARLVRFITRSWFRWWRAEPQAAALYTLVWAAAVAAWLISPAAPGHAAVAGLPVVIRIAIGVAGAIVLGGIPGALLAKWRVAHWNSAQTSGQ